MTQVSSALLVFWAQERFGETGGIHRNTDFQESYPFLYLSACRQNLDKWPIREAWNFK